MTGRKSSDGGMGAGVAEMKCYLRNVPLAWRRVEEVLRRELGRRTCEGGRVTEGVPHTSRHSNDSDNCSSLLAVCLFILSELTDEYVITNERQRKTERFSIDWRN